MEGKIKIENDRIIYEHPTLGGFDAHVDTVCKQFFTYTNNEVKKSGNKGISLLTGIKSPEDLMKIKGDRARDFEKRLHEMLKEFEANEKVKLLFDTKDTKNGSLAPNRLFELGISCDWPTLIKEFEDIQKDNM